MPTYSFNPNQGEVSNLSAQDRLRQANADRMIQMTLANMQAQQNAAQMNAAERLGYAQIAGNKDLATISGDYNLRTQELANQGQLGVEGLRGQNLVNLAGITGKNAADVARINVGPQQSMADLANRESDRNYEDKKQSLDYLINKMLVDQVKAGSQNSQLPQGISMSDIYRSKLNIPQNPIEAAKIRQGVEATEQGVSPEEYAANKAQERAQAYRAKYMTAAQGPMSEIESGFANEAYISDSDINDVYGPRVSNMVRMMRSQGFKDEDINNVLLELANRLRSSYTSNKWLAPRQSVLSGISKLANIANY